MPVPLTRHTPGGSMGAVARLWRRQHVENNEFDLDISVLESGDGQATLINLTDDGCGSTCSSPCATNVA